MLWNRVYERLSRSYEGILIQFQVVRVISTLFKWEFKGLWSFCFRFMRVDGRFIELNRENKVEWFLRSWS